ncbi:MAG: maltotransferase domain-containing protein, partial [Vicinamibacterales bacterium]
MPVSPGQPYPLGAAWPASSARHGSTTDLAGPIADAGRVVVERLHPEIDGGRFPIKRTVGELVSVSVDMFADGHDVIGGVLKYRPAAPEESSPWLEVPLTDLGDDRWGATFTVTELGEYEYTVEGWIDRFE